MSLPVDAITNKRLVLVKQLYQQGIQPTFPISTLQGVP